MKYGKLVTGLVAVAIPSAALATLWQTMDAESATISGSQLLDNGWSFSLAQDSQGFKPALSSTRARSGSNSVFFKINAGTDTYNDRSELTITSGTPFDQERWFSFAVYVPSNFQAHPLARWLILSQVWQYSPASPPIALEFKPNTTNRLQLIVRNDDTGTSATNIVKNDIPITTGAWNTIQVGFRLSTSTSGFVRLIVNGQTAHTYTGKVGYTGTQGTVQPRVGLYGSTSSAMHEIWVDDIKYASTQAEVAP